MARKARKQYDNVVTLHENNKKRDVVLVPRNLNQEDYIDILLDPEVVIAFGIGPAGTGKTMLAVQAAIREYKQGNIEKIVITRPAVGVDDERHGFLPGDINQKMEPWMRPIFDVFHEYYNPKEVQKMIEDQIVELSPLAFMRGRTFKNSYIIADEMQNASPNQMKMLLTRIGEGSYMAVTGDVAQADKKDRENGLLDFDRLLDRFGQTEYIDMVKFGTKDIERHPAVSEVLKIYGD